MLRDGRPAAVPVTIGLDDGTHVEITGDSLALGDPVIVDAAERSRRARTRATALAAPVLRPPAVSDTVIEVTDVARTYRLGDVEVRALRGVNLRIERGEFVAIMGASGSGKSTLMNVLGCLDQPTSGSYRLEGVDVSRADEARARAGAQPAHRLRVPELQSAGAHERRRRTSRCPLFYAGRLEDGSERAREALRSLGLAGREKNHPSQLSGGQQQRVAIARALINDPAILLADEPTGNLDSATANEIMTTLRALNREQGLTIVLVTHEPDMAAFADRVVTMRDGVIVSDERTKPSVAPPVRCGAAPERAGREEPTPRSSSRCCAWRCSSRAAPSRATSCAPRSPCSAIFIGVAALITMVAVGQGANQAVIAQIESPRHESADRPAGRHARRAACARLRQRFDAQVADAEAIRRDASAVEQRQLRAARRGAGAVRRARTGTRPCRA